MEVYTVQRHLNKKSDENLRDHSNNTNNVKTNTTSAQSHVIESGNTKVTLSSKALTMIDIEKSQSDKVYQQQKIEYGVAKRQYEDRVNDLPVDYRKMKMIKDRMNEEIKVLKAAVLKIKQSITLNEEEIKQKIGQLEQQIAVKSLAIVEIGKEFSQKLKEQERSKQISPESATEMLKTFHSSPPDAPEQKLL